jgi:hypothetical protein
MVKTAPINTEIIRVMGRELAPSFSISFQVYLKKSFQRCGIENVRYIKIEYLPT